jgi:tetratricopeptide (TPR) repeat protein
VHDVPGTSATPPVASPASATAGPRPASRVIGARYQLINKLGHGGMGDVYRVLDRVTGRIVTLKRLRVQAGTPDAGRDSREDRLTLANEFRLLAALRHPNIVSVLAYGFDEERQPYFTTDLEEAARTITEAGFNQPLALQVELLAQALRAIAYLHRHGIIHRDLKPENILVVRDQVKVLDFGLSIHAAESELATRAGTLRYMAPEVLRGDAPSERCDLYAFGLVAFEMLTGAYPSEGRYAGAVFQGVTGTRMPAGFEVLDARLRPILHRLLAKRPEDRYADATDVIAALSVALNLPLADETVMTRESFLQSAPLVGRDAELAELTRAVRGALDGKGAARLVAGESGVGKSRLLDELRIQALVEGVLVVRGQAMRDGGGPYHLWRDVVRDLVVRVDVADADARALQPAAPDIEALLGRNVEAEPCLDGDAAQLRLLVALEQILRQQRDPVVVLLEDLQWAGSESLKVFGWLAQAVERLPVVLVGSYRDDEAPRLGDAFSHVDVLRLQRLDARATEALVESMVGPAGRRPEVMALVERESEGIPFFIVEVVRVLAENAGGLGRIEGSRLPRRVISGGIQKIVRRRLDRVAPDALAPLHTAAVIGRAIDPQLMAAIHPALRQDEWVLGCSEAGVLEVREQTWRFAHDKLREELLENSAPQARRLLHRRVAEAIEADSGRQQASLTALAHHWRQAGEPAKEVEYAHRAGVLALQSGACQEAVAHLTRALEVMRTTLDGADRVVPSGRTAGSGRSARARWLALLDPTAALDPDSAAFRLGMVESWLTEAYFRIGDLPASAEHAERALRHFGHDVPSRTVVLLVDVVRQCVRLALQGLFRFQPADAEKTRRLATEIARVQGRFAEACFYSLRMLPLVSATLRQINLCRPAGPELELAQAYIFLAGFAGMVAGPRPFDRWSGHILEIVERTGNPRAVAYVLSRTAAYEIVGCRWDAADAHVARAIETARDVGDMRLWTECHSLMGAAAHYSGRYERGLRLYADAQGLSQRSGNQQTECWALSGQADLLLRLGRNDEALALYDAATAKLDIAAMQAESIAVFGMRALAWLRAGNENAAHDAAERALSYIARAAPVAYWTQQGMAATAEVFLTLLERRRDPTDRAPLMMRSVLACQRLRQFARNFPLGRPHAHLWTGLLAWQQGRRRRALRCWQRAIEAAEQRRTPYERGRAHLEFGRHLDVSASARRYHLDQAADVFEKLGAAADLARVRAELGHGAFDARSPGAA